MPTAEDAVWSSGPSVRLCLGDGGTEVLVWSSPPPAAEETCASVGDLPGVPAPWTGDSCRCSSGRACRSLETFAGRSAPSILLAVMIPLEDSAEAPEAALALDTDRAVRSKDTANAQDYSRKLVNERQSTTANT